MMASQEPQRDEPTLEEPARRRLHLREVRSDTADYDGIGAELRAARVRAGIDLADAAQKLRISKAYLEALELGRFDELPGDVYVFGFLRTYARFLELDENIAIDRYRTEAARPRGDTRLEFPSAMDRGRMPTGRLLLGGLVVAIVAYAAWFVLTSEERSTAERVAPVPDRIVTSSATTEPTATEATSAGPAVDAAAEPVEDVTLAPSPAPSAATAEPPTTSEDVVPPDTMARIPGTTTADDAAGQGASPSTPPPIVSSSTEATAPVEAPAPPQATPGEDQVVASVDAPAVENAVAPGTASEDTVAQNSASATVTPNPAVESDNGAAVSPLPPVVRRAPETGVETPAQIENAAAPAQVEDAVPPTQVENAAPPAQVAANSREPTADAPLTDLRARQLAEASSAPLPSLPPANPASSATTVDSSTPSDESQVATTAAPETPPPLATTQGDQAEPAATGGYVPRVFGAGNEDARIVLVAESDSWVQVRSSGGELLLTRVLRPGDRYLVPDRPGLVMMTGNVGALRVVVDGEPVPYLGPPGVIGRDIPLDPTKLRAGEITVSGDESL